MNDHPVLDLAGVLERVEGDKDLLLELMELFARDKQKQIELIRGGLQRGNGAELSSSAHAIKSALGNLGAMKAWDLAAQLERAGKEGRLSDAPGLFSALETSVDEFERTFAGLHAKGEV
jgi:HPt (histidine-containing phosphotransfer) domain-containing protein